MQASANSVTLLSIQRNASKPSIPITRTAASSKVTMFRMLVALAPTCVVFKLAYTAAKITIPITPAIATTEAPTTLTCPLVSIFNQLLVSATL